ncbi:H-2 class II histocompatibility antigen%2C A-U alpha chain-like [Xyrichtys novacula]|uniref:H-2 class II histocompatibility antigen, A-U alpha chain-like n=1 Tax=Xyrichtys novacula TaxID=13765 RepID=A0AAV1FN54_XYRNO|nr:H-2 class II histocompatibility antigen%2C A-U alpha chain-like [Xyrichtys novacula]
MMPYCSQTSRCFSFLFLMLNIFSIFSQTPVPHETVYAVGCFEDSTTEVKYEIDNEEVLYIDFKKHEIIYTVPPFILANPSEIVSGISVYKNALRARIACPLLLAIVKAEEKHVEEEKDPPESALYPAEEVQPGVENSLICFVNHFYPPRIRVTWTKNGNPVTEGVSLSRYYPNKDQTFHQLATLKFTPNNRDIYTCTVEHIALASPQTSIWEVDVSHPSVGADVFCGVGVILGLFGVAGGTFLMAKGLTERQ